jgi:aspartyl-tRNA(Asn)/glutamyl-tRNA(Gln) amidotransferase subunit B
MRVEANISVSKLDGVLGTKVEVKNLNSFRSVERAIDYEVVRHIELLEKGEEIVQETRGWDENKQSTFSQRKKENSHDYRYFPDPDLPKMRLSEVTEFDHEAIKVELPELPWEKRARYTNDYKLSEQHVEFFVGKIGSPKETIDREYFDKIVSHLDGTIKAIHLAANYVAVDLEGINKKEKGAVLFYPKPEHMASLVKMILSNELSSRGAKDVLEIMCVKDQDPRNIAENKGLFQKSNTEEIEIMLKTIIDANPNVVTDYKAGKEVALMFFVGQVMKLSKGSANPAMTKELAVKLLNN